MKKKTWRKLLIVLLLALPFVIAAIPLANRIQKEKQADADQKRLDQIYAVTAPELTEKEKIAAKRNQKWLEQNTTFSDALAEDFANVFIRCARFKNCSEHAQIVSVAETERDDLWITYTICTENGFSVDFTRHNSPQAKKVKFVTMDGSLLYAESLP